MNKNKDLVFEQNEFAEDKQSISRRCGSGSLTPLALLLIGSVAVLGQASGRPSAEPDQTESRSANPVLEWNQIFIDTLVATNTANSVSQRLGAIVHTAIFDAYNGIEQRYTPVFVHGSPQAGASKKAAVIAAAYTALVDLFPSQKAALDARYAASLAALSDDDEDGGRSRQLGIDWGIAVADKVVTWRAGDGFNLTYPPFNGGTAVGQWRPTPPGFGSISAQALAFTAPFVLNSNMQFRPGPPRGLLNPIYAADFEAIKALGRGAGSIRTGEQTALALFWDGNTSIHWNDAANQIARANHLSLSDSNRLFAVLNIAMADTALTVWSAKRFYGSLPTAVTWRPITAITLADTDGNPGTVPDPAWLPLITTPSHPEYPAGHPSMNGSAATILLSYFGPQQTFTLTTPGQPARTYTNILQARLDADSARVWGGMHYPSTVAISDGVGQAVATYVNRNSIQPLHPGDFRERQ